MSLRSTMTVCTMDCPDACSLIVSEEPDGRIRIRGNPEHPITQGFACPKMRSHLRRLKSHDRIIYPMRRSGTNWERIDWEEALSLCAEKIQAYRGEPASILYFHGEGAKGALKQAGHLLFNVLGASGVRGSLCDAAGYSACRKDFGSNEGSDIETMLDSSSIVNWGKDLLRSSIHMAFFVRMSRRQGAKVLTISPGSEFNRAYSDAMICIRPGTDRFLAAAVARLFMDRQAMPKEVMEHSSNYHEFARLILECNLDDLLKRCGVSREQAELVYEFYANMHPTVTIIGAGLQRYYSGGETVRFINALAMLTGNMGIRGGGSFFHLSSLRNFNLSWTRADGKRDIRLLPMPLIGQEIAKADKPPIRMIWVDGSNVVNQAPNAVKNANAFEGIEFKVVVDAFMTDTAQRADLILPSALMLEQEDLVASYLHDYVYYARPALDPPGEVKSDFQIFTELGRRLSPPVVLPDAETCMRHSLDSPYLDVSLEELKGASFVRAGRKEVAFEGMVFSHADEKYRFPDVLRDDPMPPSGFPLRLLSLIRKRSMHSQMLPEDQEMPPRVWIASDCEALSRLELDKAC
ncbi:MAG TPA: molybdopterin-dependent oxidoreductase, partial [Desulfomonilia bacterium]|nr:molybdopterin-dependent oxidoreductase [Desulfomonilia bacterium]